MSFYSDDSSNSSSPDESVDMKTSPSSLPSSPCTVTTLEGTSAVPRTRTKSRPRPTREESVITMSWSSRSTCAARATRRSDSAAYLFRAVRTINLVSRDNGVDRDQHKRDQTQD